MKKIITVDGNEACARTAYYFTELSSIYPITPSSPMAEHLDEWSSNKETNLFNEPVKVVEMQSEAGAAGMVHGSLQAGVLTTTFTASQGLLLMIPNLYKLAGELLPGVLHVAARSLSTHALSIFGDHQDIYAARSTGVCMIASSNVEDASYLSGITHLSALKASVPFIHFFDGFRTSHEINKIQVLEKEDWKQLLDQEAIENFRKRALSTKHPITRGTNQNDDIYFQATEARNQFYEKVPDIVNEYMRKVNEISGKKYQPFNYYGSSKAKYLIVAMGSVSETIKETLPLLGDDFGFVEVHLYRPFSTEYLKQVLPKTVEKIAVLDRTKEAGANEPLYLDVLSSLKDLNIIVVGGRYGLSSKNTTPNQIKAVYDMLVHNPHHNFVIGINDDVTNLSLKVDPNFKINNHDEFLIYGYGSDGMVSAGKSLIKLVGDNTNKFVQGYFQYDSKKSGGVTIGHLRFSDQLIQSTYYVENPKLIVLSKDSYLSEFDIVNEIKENGIFLINTEKTEEQLKQLFSDTTKSILAKRHIKIYLINAYELARKVGLGNKTSTIMETALLSLSPLVDFEFAKKELKTYAHDHFFKKGERVVQANYDAIDEATNYIKEIKMEDENKEIISKKITSVYQAMIERKGNELPVSAFLEAPDGSFEPGTTFKERRNLSDIVPRWLSDNCIQCNQCSFVCPHGVIRPYLLTEEEYDKAPSYVQKRCVKSILKGHENDYFIISICVQNCTGCGLCIQTCPGKLSNKALISDKLETMIKEQEQAIFDYLSEHIKDKEVLPNTVIGTQFKQPKFAFHGACAGCGETAYIKLLTQLFKERLVIANATGCSSIYGGSCPSTPYLIPWASSLFEDNAEYSYGIMMANNLLRNRLLIRVEHYLEQQEDELLNNWYHDSNNIEIIEQVLDQIDKYPIEIQELKDYFLKPSVWALGGDGWAYDIGFSGIDHVLANNDDINILVLDTQVYSNTGGQTSKATPVGAIASFATSGKKTCKKDLARIALTYPNAYVAQVSLGANMLQLIKAMKEAEAHNGPSIIIAYAPCISHGIKGGMKETVNMERLATSCGYFPIFRYVPEQKKFYLDSKNVDFEKYEDFLMSQNRFLMLSKVNEKDAKELLELNKQSAIERYEYYKRLSEQM